MHTTPDTPTPFEGSFRPDLIQSPEALRQFFALLDEAFALPEGHHFTEDFPVWDPKQGAEPSASARLGLFQGERLAAGAGVRLAQLRTPAGALPIALIGAVATDEEFRGQGLATRVVGRALEWARGKGAALVLLWGSEHSLYQRMGFELCGQQARLPIQELDLGPARAGERVGDGWVPGIFALMQHRPDGLALVDADRRWMEAHRNVEWYWAGPRENPTAYAAYGRGVDLPGMIHEWGGDPAALRGLLAQLKLLRPGAQLLGGPWAFKRLGFPLAAGAPVEYLCLARVLDPVRVAQSFMPQLPCRAQMTKDGWRFSIGPEVKILSDGELSRYLFGPPDHAPVVAEDRLPLWVWGLDAS